MLEDLKFPENTTCIVSISDDYACFGIPRDSSGNSIDPNMPEIQRAMEDAVAAALKRFPNFRRISAAEQRFHFECLAELLDDPDHRIHYLDGQYVTEFHTDDPDLCEKRAIYFGNVVNWIPILGVSFHSDPEVETNSILKNAGPYGPDDTDYVAWNYTNNENEFAFIRFDSHGRIGIVRFNPETLRGTNLRDVYEYMELNGFDTDYG